MASNVLSQETPPPSKWAKCFLTLVIKWLQLCLACQDAVLVRLSAPTATASSFYVLVNECRSLCFRFVIKALNAGPNVSHYASLLHLNEMIVEHLGQFCHFHNLVLLRS
jgi:hypothetical protein